MNRNLGDTGLKQRRRSVDPMGAYDALPLPLRHWLSQAALPWSPTSARKIWKKALGQGLCADDALAVLHRSEAQTLARDKRAIHPTK